MKAKIIGRKNGFDVEIQAIYDPFFKTIAFGPAVVPVKEVKFYLDSLYGVEFVDIIQN